MFFIEGPRRVLEILRLVKIQKQVTRGIVEKYIISGAWFSHREAVLTTLLCSSIVEERTHTSSLNMDAKNLTELCSWTHNVFEPIQTCSFSSETVVDIKVNM